MRELNVVCTGAFVKVWLISSGEKLGSRRTKTGHNNDKYYYYYYYYYDDDDGYDTRITTTTNRRNSR